MIAVAARVCVVVRIHADKREHELQEKHAERDNPDGVENLPFQEQGGPPINHVIPSLRSVKYSAPPGQGDYLWRARMSVERVRLQR